MKPARRFTFLWLALPEVVRIAVVIVILIVLGLLAGCATAPPGPTQQITVAASRMERCKLEGGCFLVSRKEVKEMLSEAWDLGAASIVDDLDNHSCRRGKT